MALAGTAILMPLGLSLNVPAPIDVETTRHTILLSLPATAEFRRALDERFAAIGTPRPQRDICLVGT